MKGHFELKYFDGIAYVVADQYFELRGILEEMLRMKKDYDQDPDSNGNRHYDYISIEEYEAAEKTLQEKEHWQDLTSHEIVVLRQKLHEHGRLPDLIDVKDRLALIRCLLITIQNQKDWQENAYAAGYDMDKHGWAGKPKEETFKVK